MSQAQSTHILAGSYRSPMDFGHLTFCIPQPRGYQWKASDIDGSQVSLETMVRNDHRSAELFRYLSMEICQ